MSRRHLVAAALLLAILAPLALVVPRANIAGAHAVLVRSSPESQEQLRDPPPVIDLWFSEPLEPDFSSFELFASNGTRLDLAGMRLDPADPQHLAALTRGLGPGIYTVVYRTLSTRDGHEWSGSTTFTVLNPDGSVPAGTGFAPNLPDASSPGEITGRWFVFTAFAVFAGGVLVSLLAVTTQGARTGPLARRTRRLSVRLGIAALPLAAGGSLLELLARQDALGGSAIDLLADTRFGTVLLWRFLALLAIAAALGLALLAARRRGEPAERLLAAVAAIAALGALVTISLLSHAAAAPGSFWALLVDVVHLLLAATWAGGLILIAALLLQLRRSQAGTADRLPVAGLVARFSIFATTAIGLLVATGLVRAAGELPTANALIDTDYGIWLLIKLALLLIPLAIALRNRATLARWQRSAFEEHELRRRLRRTLPIEAGLAVAVLAIVAVLGQVPTPRGEAPAGGGAAVIATDVNLIEQVDDLTIHLQVSPAVVGRNELRVHLYHADGSAIGAVQRVQLELSAGGAVGGGTGGDAIEPALEGNDIYTANASFTSLALDWSVAVDVRREDTDDARLDFSVPIQLAAAQDGASRFDSPAPQLSRNFLWVLLLFPIGLTLLALGARKSNDASSEDRGPSSRRARSRAASSGSTPLGAIASRLPGPSLRLAGVVTVFVALLLAISGSPHSHGGQFLTNPVPNDLDSIARGNVLYQANCTGCHGTTGRGDGPLAATLSPAPANLSQHIPLHPEGDTYTFIANGFPNTAMPAWADRLTAAEIWDLVNFLRSEFAE